MKSKTAEQWLIDEGYPESMPITRDTIANIINHYNYQFQNHVPANKSIADLNHIVINACMNLYAITEKHEDIDKIIEAVKSFTSQHPVHDEAGGNIFLQIESIKRGMAEYFMQHNYRELYGMFQNIILPLIENMAKRLSPAPPSGEDAGKGWISVEDENMPLETDLIVKHPFGVEAIHFFNAEWTFWYTGKSCGSDLIKSITHWQKP